MTKTDDTKEATKHTPEPWTEEFLPYVSNISSGRETEIPCYRIHPLDTPEEYICETNEHLGDEVQYANARRIVAAVNACTGISTEALEQGAIAEMLNALLILEKRCKSLGWSEPLMRIIYHAIAKATGRAATPDP